MRALSAAPLIGLLGKLSVLTILVFGAVAAMAGAVVGVAAEGEPVAAVAGSSFFSVARAGLSAAGCVLAASWISCSTSSPQEPFSGLSSGFFSAGAAGSGFDSLGVGFV